MMNAYIAEVLDVVARRNAAEPEFLQAVREVLESAAALKGAWRDGQR